MTAVHKLFLKWLSGDLSLEDFEEAKGKEKEQIITARLTAPVYSIPSEEMCLFEAKKYYNKTYKNK